MSCMVCLEGGAKNTNIWIDSTKGYRLGVKKIIEKHLWNMKVATATPPTRLAVCQECWKLLFSFNQFYLRVQRAHEKLTVEICDVELPTPTPADSIHLIPTEPLTDFKVECGNIKIEAGETFAQEICVLPKRRRGRPRKLDTVEKQLPRRTLRSAIEMVNVQEQQVVRKAEEELMMPITVIKDEQTYVIDALPHAESETELQCDALLQEADDDDDDNEDDYQPSKGPKEKVSRQFDDFIASNFKLSCCLCHVSMADFRSLMQHFRVQHKMRGYVVCCGKKLLKRCVLVDHIRLHLDPQYFKCPRCEKILANRRCLELHLKGHDRSKERIYRCVVCSKSYYRRTVYKRHMLLHLPEEQKSITCPQCDKTFATTYLMNQHLRLTHLNVYAKICDICGKSIRGKDALLRHQAEHAGVPQEPIKCEICGLTLTTKYGLARHMKVMHNAENRQQQVCSICSKVSPSVTAHRRHLQFMHSMERKYACQMCEKAFKRATDLREHMTTHTGEVLYTCPHCPKTFNSNANMYSHRKKVHRKEWEDKRRQKYQIAQRTHPQQQLVATPMSASSKDIVVAGS